MKPKPISEANHKLSNDVLVISQAHIYIKLASDTRMHFLAISRFLSLRRVAVPAIFVTTGSLLRVAIATVRALLFTDASANTL